MKFPMLDIPRNQIVLHAALIVTKRRVTFDIEYQHTALTHDGPDDGDYMTFVASNGFQIYSRSRPDIDTDRCWLLGAVNGPAEDRSGSKPFPSYEMRDKYVDRLMEALQEWVEHTGGAIRLQTFKFDREEDSYVDETIHLS